MKIVAPVIPVTIVEQYTPAYWHGYLSALKEARDHVSALSLGSNLLTAPMVDALLSAMMKIVEVKNHD